MSSVSESKQLFSAPPALDQGLICAFEISPHAPTRSIDAEAISASLAKPGVVVWLHFNLNDARARRWLIDEAPFVPDVLREVLNEHDGHRRIEHAEDGMLLVINDLTFEDESDPAEVAPLWCFASQRLLITARMHPLKSADELRALVRGDLRVNSAFQLVATLFELRTTALRKLSAEMLSHIDGVEDEILAGRITRQREQLGRTRRLCARLRRHFGPEWNSLRLLMQRTLSDIDEESRDHLRSAVEDLGFVMEEVSELYERAKLLQEELTSRVAENTNRNLYVLAILTAVFLPMTLITGIFGMNVAGLPGMRDSQAFWDVMLLIIAAGAATLGGLLWRRS